MDNMNLFNQIVELVKKDYSDKNSKVTLANAKESLEFFAVVLLLGILPIYLILLDIIPYSYRMYVIFLIGFALVLLEKIRRISWHDLGFRKDTLKSSVVVNGLISLVVGSVLLVLYFFDMIPTSGMPSQSPLFFVFYVVLLGPIQELIFRSIVFAEFKRAAITDHYIKIILSAAIFVLPHLIYENLSITLVSIFIGLTWGWVYNRYPNWLGVAVSHSTLGAIAIAVGLI